MNEPRESPPPRHRRDGTGENEAFARLLDWLAKGGDRGQAYETLRRKLIGFFRWRRQWDSEDLADRTIDRVLQKLREGAVREDANPYAYFYGVARNILREHQSAGVRRHTALKELAEAPSETDGGETDSQDRLDCLERCLATLSPHSRDLITSYYIGDQSEKIANRQALAERFGIPRNALWIRAHRVRLALEACIKTCAGDRSGKSIAVLRQRDTDEP